jgi:hypothetical protein
MGDTRKRAWKGSIVAFQIYYFDTVLEELRKMKINLNQEMY